MFGRISTRLTIFGICLAAGCGDAGGGPELPEDTESGALGLVETIPAPLETDVDTDADLSVLFDEPLSPSSVTSDTVTVESSKGAHSGTVSLAGEDMLVFTPSAPLALLSEYTATVHGVEAQSGALLADEHSWRFTTRDGRWGPEHELSHALNQGDRSQITVGPNGEAIAAWVEYSSGAGEQVWSSRYSPDTGWGRPERIDTVGAREVKRVAVAFDDEGSAIATWRQWDTWSSTSIWANRYSPTTGWEVAQQVGAYPQPSFDIEDRMSLAVYPDGSAVLAWSDSADLRACRFDPATGWTTAETVHRGISTTEPYLLTGPGSTAVLLWTDYDGERQNILSAQYDPTSGWGSPELVDTEDHGSATKPRAVVDRSGNVTAVWQQSDSLRDNVWANRYTPGEGWGTARRIEASNAGDATAPRLGVDAIGNVLAVWQQSDGEQTRALSNRYTVTGGWGVAEVLGAHLEGNAFEPDVVIDANGNAIATWILAQRETRHVAVSRFTATTGWEAQEDLARGSGLGTVTSLGIGRDGRAFAIWHEWPDGEAGFSLLVRRFE
jgi:hypothetical protein